MSPRSPTHSQVGGLTTMIAVLVAGTALTLASLASVGYFRHSAAWTADEPPTPLELAATLARVGVTAETLAAAGCSASDATTLVGYARGELDEAVWSGLRAADQRVHGAQTDVDRLGRLIRAGQASQDDLAAADAASSSLASAVASRDAILDGLFDAAVDGLAQDEVLGIETMHGNRDRPVPLSYTLAARSDADWTGLRDALANLKTAAKCGEEPDSRCEQLVTQFDAEPAVAAARSRLDSNLAEVTAAFHTALGLE